MTHSFAGLVRNEANDLCVAIQRSSDVVRTEVENLRRTIEKPGTDRGFVEAAKIGLKAADEFQAERRAGRRSLSEIPYDFEALGPKSPDGRFGVRGRQSLRL